MTSPEANRGQPLLLGTAMGVKPEKGHRDGKRIGEVAGGTAAECTAICCCCPCAVMHLLVLAVYKVPTGLCKKAYGKTQQKRLMNKKKKILMEDENQRTAINKKSGALDGIDHGDGSDGRGAVDGVHDYDDEKGVGVIEAVEFDSEMWDRFYGTGFWRSSSQRDETENEIQKQNLK